MISVDDAQALIAQHRPRLGVERVPLAEALGRRLAADLTALTTAPPHDVSAMDGYAVRSGDLKSGRARLRVIGEAPAGEPFVGAVGTGEAVRLFTGSAVPSGADRVVMQEEAERAGDTVLIATDAGGPRFVRRAGGDFRAGDTLIGAGERLGPAHILAAAAGDHAELEVLRRPRVALLANGDELRPPGSGSGGIIAANGYGLAALVRRWGGEAIDLGIARDAPEAIRAKIAMAGEADIVVAIGGASVGERDHMVAAFADAGFETIFRKVAVKPGKPSWFAREHGRLALGLPGNPASAFVCAHLFLRMLVAGEPIAPVAGVTTQPLPAIVSRETYSRATSAIGPDGVRRVTVNPRQDSALITPFLECDCLVRRAAHAPALAAGSIVATLPLV